MTKLNEISELLKQAEAKVESLKAEMTAMTAMEYDPTWKPVAGGRYCFHTAGGATGNDLHNNHPIDTHRLRCNNVFKTEAEAELYLKIFNRIHELNDQDPVDWGSHELKYYFYYNRPSGGLSQCSNVSVKIQGVTYMTAATVDKIRAEFTDKELEVWVRR